MTEDRTAQIRMLLEETEKNVVLGLNDDGYGKRESKQK
jgi:hypothetical protein